VTEFTVLGPPHVKGSTVSFIGHDGRVVTKTDSVGLRGWSRDVFWAAKAASVPLARQGEPVRVHVWFHFPFPRKGRRSPTIRPDIDKLTRALLDALAGAAYLNDAQVVELIAFKVYAADARTIVSIGTVAEE
jgi:Holliday junction resolvase RusA-like endonuclease